MPGRECVEGAVALGLFDAIDAHPWVGAQLTREPWRPPLLDIYGSVSGHLQALGVLQRAVSDSAGVLVNHILGVAGQNAANVGALANNADKDGSARQSA